MDDAPAFVAGETSSGSKGEGRPPHSVIDVHGNTVDLSDDDEVAGLPDDSGLALANIAPALSESSAAALEQSSARATVGALQALVRANNAVLVPSGAITAEEPTITVAAEVLEAAGVGVSQAPRAELLALEDASSATPQAASAAALPTVEEGSVLDAPAPPSPGDDENARKRSRTGPSAAVDLSASEEESFS